MQIISISLPIMRLFFGMIHQIGIDLVAEMPKALCIFELKLDKIAEVAFGQTEAKKYREKFSQSEQDTLVMSINFSSKSRDIGNWKGALVSSAGKRTKEFSP